MELLEGLGRRWTLRVLWELRESTLSFRALRDACDGISPSVLNTRLTELRDMGLVETSEAGYVLSKDGRELGVRLLDLDEWARGWSRRQSKKEKPPPQEKAAKKAKSASKKKSSPKKKKKNSKSKSKTKR